MIKYVEVTVYKDKIEYVCKPMNEFLSFLCGYCLAREVTPKLKAICDSCGAKVHRVKLKDTERDGYFYAKN